MTALEEDLERYGSRKRMPKFQLFYRKAQQTRFAPLKLLYLVLLRRYRVKNLCDFPAGLSCGGGLFINHPYCIVINPDAVIGSHVTLSKGVTIGQENRGPREGSPTIGDMVCICPNATVVGNIRIGSDVVIAPNAFVNCDVPDHSIVIGNPCMIKHRENATEGYI